MWAISLFIVGLLVLAYHQRSALYYSIYGLLGCVYCSFYPPESMVGSTFAWSLWLIWLVFIQITPIRKFFLSKPLLKIYQKVQPKLSSTEAEALAAGTVDWDAELFSGKPNWQRLWQKELTQLSAEEEAFLNGPVEILCAKMGQHRLVITETDIPEDIWQMLKDEGFFGLQISKQYGGLGFSKTATALILAKIASCCNVLAAMISVPNSLGPAELLVEYGTDEQKNYYLPRLAKGIDVPCFALTSPEAGSDASAMPDYGVVTHGNWQGNSVLGIKVTWNKRYITLAPKATVLGLAFKLYDPEHLLGANDYIGITSVLIPTDHPGVQIGRRHFIGNGYFINGPTSGKEVFIPLEWIIGGVERKGQGWRMLTESLSAGRAMALPGMSLGGLYATTLATSAYAQIRKQFNVPIAHFEGIQEKIAAMAIALYQTEVMTRVTLSAVDHEEKPSVLSAVVKYHATEAARQALHHAMDIHGGKGICMGSHNYLADAYQMVPVAITVEGANILTRNMIIFGQGAIRCHRYVNRCLQAVNETDKNKQLTDFDDAIWGHIAQVISLWPRVIWQSFTAAWLIWPGQIQEWRTLQKTTRFSARFAFLTEICFLVYGSRLKFSERVSARMADMFIHLYAISCILKYKQEKEDVALWSSAMAKLLNEACLNESFFAIDKASFDLLQQLPNRFLRTFLTWLCLPWGRKRITSKDKWKKSIAHKLTEQKAFTEKAVGDRIYTDGENSVLARLLEVHQMVVTAKPLYEKLHTLHYKGQITEAILTNALHAHLLTHKEIEQLQAVEKAIAEMIAVDDFSAQAFSRQ